MPARNISMTDLLIEAMKLPPVPLSSINAYHRNIPLMTKHVDDVLASCPDINRLIGNNPLQVMFDNHRHHACFMSAVFSISGYELLAKTVPWVYHAYSAHGFSYDYFPLELRTWIQALDKFIDPALTGEIKTVYEWMISRHEDMISLSKTNIETPSPIDADWLERKNSFLSALLNGDSKKCLDMTTSSCATDIEKFYLQIIQPVMYEIGMLWERAEISAAQEHLASAIVGRAMAAASMVSNRSSGKSRGKAVITSSPNEYHEIGGWMISDILEHDGWDVRYLGGNVPHDDVLGLLRSFRPDILAISVTMPFNIDKAKALVTGVREDRDIRGIKIMVGGRPFNEVADLWRSIGADGFAVNAQEARRLASEWSSLHI